MNNLLSNIYKFIPKEEFNNFYHQKEIIEFLSIPSHLKSFIYSQKRGNCGVVVIDFVNWQNNSNSFKKINGLFYCDNPCLDFKSFTKEEIIKMSVEGFNCRNINDRKIFAEKYNIIEELKQIPHCWIETLDGKIIDFSGHNQFVTSGLSLNIQSNKYLKSNLLDNKNKSKNSL